MRRSLPVLFVLALVSRAAAQSPDELIRETMKRERIPALAACVVVRGQVAYQKGFGYVDAEKTKVVNANTRFPIASLSKPMVAMAVLKLVEQGRLRLDAPIGDLLPDLPETWRAIPLRRLLDHTSGIPSQTDTEAFARGSTRAIDPTEKLQLITKLPLRFSSGARYEYSNGNYMLAGLIVDRVGAKSHEAFLEEFMFAPLGMKSTRPLSAELQKELPTPHGKRGEEAVPVEPIHPSWNDGNGALVSTVADLARWDAALYTERILRSNTLEYITTDQRLNNGQPVGYAMGWGLGQVLGNRSINHTGRLWGYQSYFARSADHNVTVILLANQDTCDLHALARNLAGYLVPALPCAPSDPSPTPTPTLRATTASSWTGSSAGR